MNLTEKPSRRHHRLLATLAAAIALLAVALMAPAAQAEFGFNYFDADITNEDGSAATQAGSHPFAVTTRIEVNYGETAPGQYAPDEELKDGLVDFMPGFIGTATYPRCKMVDFISKAVTGGTFGCSDETVVGQVGTLIDGPFPFYWIFPMWHLEPPAGVAARLAFLVVGTPVFIDVTLNEEGNYNVQAASRGIPQPLAVFASVLQIWGDPSDPAHDRFRGNCGVGIAVGPPPSEMQFEPNFANKSCPVEERAPFLTLPTSCAGPQPVGYEIASWQNPGKWVTGGVLTHDQATPPNPQGFTGCGKLAYSPTIESKVTTDSAETGSGLDFDLAFNDQGLTNPKGLAQSQTKKAVVTLPEGVTVNPSIGEGLGVCTPDQLARETVDSKPGEGCPNASTIGTVHLETPIIEKPVDGAVYLAQQDDPSTTKPGAENPFDSLIAAYFVFKSRLYGQVVKLPALIEPDPNTGQLVVTVDNAPQVPFSSFQVHLREGQRAPLVSPNACGTYTTKAKLYPYSDPTNPRTVTSPFEITQGLGGGPCPPGGIPPFHPGFEAGSLNNNAGSFSPFNMRLIRNDGEQDMTKFSSILPPGELGSLAGVSKCPDSAIAIAKSKTGREELASPSCPANSLIGHTSAGAGVGGALTYVGGQIYLGGPYKGRPLSVISVTPAVAGPFDAGTVVVRLALNLNPKTAEVEVDGAASDPIPHILKGIVLKIRDLRVYVDRPNFTLNPTSCDESSAKATLFGSYLDVFNPADDVPVGLSTRYQAANCLNLGFKPKLDLDLKGGTKRGGHPGLLATYTPRSGDANVKGLVVRLPRSAFLDQAHIKTICTRVQFAADACPKGSQYGFITAWTPLLDEPLAGPAYLRSSSHKLPDLVFDLHGLVDVEVATRIDSQRGGIRATVEDAPDAPLSKVVLRMQGAKKGLIINSRNLCGAKSRANVTFTGHNGKEASANPVMQPDCGGKRKHKRSRG